MNNPEFTRPRHVQALALPDWLALCHVAAAIGAVASANAPAFYAELVQPGQRKTWIQVARGQLQLEGATLPAGDGVTIHKDATIELMAFERAEVLLFGTASQ